LVTFLFVDTVLIANSSAVFAKIYREEQTSAKEILSGFKVNYFGKVGGMLLIYLFTFLWSLLLIVPGIIKGISYSMTPYILAEYPNVRAMEAIRLSKRITRGYKWEIFAAGLSFIGWILLHGLAFGVLVSLIAPIFFDSFFVDFNATIGVTVPMVPSFIPVMAVSAEHLVYQITMYIVMGVLVSLWLMPYMSTTFAGYYNELLSRALEEGIVAQSDLE